MASVLGDLNIACPMCGENVTIAVRQTGSHKAPGALVVEYHVDSTPFQSHACVLNAQHAEWSDEMDNTYPSWP